MTKILPGILILESEKYALDDNLKKIEELEQKGVIIVFGCLEDPKNIERIRNFRTFWEFIKSSPKKQNLQGQSFLRGCFWVER